MFAGVTKSELVGVVKYDRAFGGITGVEDYLAPSEANQLNYVGIPFVDYKLEMMLGKLFKIYFYPSIGYKVLKATEDGDVDAQYDRYASEFYFSVSPMLKFYLPKQIFKMEGFFAKGGLNIKTYDVTTQQIYETIPDG